MIAHSTSLRAATTVPRRREAAAQPYGRPAGRKNPAGRGRSRTRSYPPRRGWRAGVRRTVPRTEDRRHGGRREAEMSSKPKTTRRKWSTGIWTSPRPSELRTSKLRASEFCDRTSQVKDAKPLPRLYVRVRVHVRDGSLARCVSSRSSPARRPYQLVRQAGCVVRLRRSKLEARWDGTPKASLEPSHTRV